jgi:hypothetical protein
MGAQPHKCGLRAAQGMEDVISELGKFRAELSDGRMVSQPLPSAVQKQFLESVPNDTKWLVFHRHFQIDKRCTTEEQLNKSPRGCVLLNEAFGVNAFPKQ